MKTDIQSIHFTATQQLIDFIEQKLLKVERHSTKITDAEVFLRVEHATNETNKLVELKLNVTGGTLFAKAHCKSFEEAVEISVHSLIRQLDKMKEKLQEA